MKPVLRLEENKECPYCKVGTIVHRSGKYGDFLACSAFPRCAVTQHIKGTEDIGARDFKDEPSFEIINGKIVPKK